MKEYKLHTVKRPGFSVEPDLNKLAKNRWEVKSMTMSDDYLYFLLEREKRERARLA